MIKYKNSHSKQQQFVQRNNKKGIVPIILEVLSVVLLLVCYTWILEHSFSKNTMDTAVERNNLRMDTIHETLVSVLDDADFTVINTREDMDTDEYVKLQNELNKMRKLKTVRYP